MYPATFCGITDLKPTCGAVDVTGAMPLSQSNDHIGSLARSAQDCALVMPVPDKTGLGQGCDSVSSHIARSEAVADSIEIGRLGQKHFGRIIRALYAQNGQIEI